MKWRGRGGAGRIEDRRGSGGGLSGGGLPIPMGKVGGGGIGTILIVLLFLFLSSRGGGGIGVDPGTGQFSPAPGASSTDLNKAPADDPAKFIDFVAGDVDATWQKIFTESGKTYEKPVIVLYDNGVQSACGNTPSTVGPFYCPRDHKVYLDLTFMEQLQQRLNAPGDFAQAYIVAHEIGHHVQNLLGVMEDVAREEQENPDSGTSCRCASSCKQTAWPESGGTPRMRRAICSRAATSTKGSPPLRRSATTGSRSSPEAR